MFAAIIDTFDYPSFDCSIIKGSVSLVKGIKGNFISQVSETDKE